jgi:hypothetical protein
MLPEGVDVSSPSKGEVFLGAFDKIRDALKELAVLNGPGPVANKYNVLEFLASSQKGADKLRDVFSQKGNQVLHSLMVQVVAARNGLKPATVERVIGDAFDFIFDLSTPYYKVAPPPPSVPGK